MSLTDGCSYPQALVNIKERVSDFVDGGLALVSDTEDQVFFFEGVGPSTDGAHLIRLRTECSESVI